MNEDNRYQLSNGLTVKPTKLFPSASHVDEMILLDAIIEFHNPTDEVKHFEPEGNWYLETPNGQIIKGYSSWIVDSETSAIAPSGEVPVLMIEFKIRGTKPIRRESKYTLHLKEEITDTSKANWTLPVDDSH